jgi:outer membrane protein TolC
MLCNRIRSLFLVIFFATPAVAASVLVQESAERGIGLMEAVKATLANQPEILLQVEEAEISRGNLKIQAGQFDTVLSAVGSRDREDVPLSSEERLLEPGVSDVVTETTTFGAGVSRLLRSGIVLNPSVQTTLTDQSPSAFDPIGTSRVDFLITVPLLRGWGSDAAAAATERAARIDYGSSLLTLRHSISQSVLNTAQAYWNYLAAFMNLDELTKSEARARNIVEDTQELIKGGEVPASEIEQLLASLASKTASRIAAEQSLYQARQNLGLALGLKYEAFAVLPPPSDAFPELNVRYVDEVRSALDVLVAQSMKLRADYMALLQDVDSAKVLMASARNDLKPVLDLDLNAGYQGLDEGEEFYRAFTPLARNVPGASVSVGLRYSFPLENNTARGSYIQRRSIYRQNEIRLYDLARNIRSNVAVALTAVVNTSLELQQSVESAAHYKQAAANERQKFQLGFSTLLDVIDLEDRLTEANLDVVSARQRFAASVAQLRFETGTILAIDQDKHFVDMERLTTVPAELATLPPDGVSGHN